MPQNPLITIGENINATRKIRVTAPRLTDSGDGKKGIKYKAIDGSDRFFDLTEVIASDAVQQSGQVPFIATAILNHDTDFLLTAVKEQLDGGADIIDLCVDEVNPYPEKRQEYMRWLIKAMQEKFDCQFSIDSSDPDTIEAGLSVYDYSKGRPVLNSTNLEENRQKVIELAKETKSQLIANASGKEGMPEDDKGRVENLNQMMQKMDKAGIPMADRFLDALVFPIGAGSEYGHHFLEAVKALREQYGPEVHIFGGFSNVSFGMPKRILLNETLSILSILAGCDTLMVDPKQVNVRKMNEFKLAADALLGKDEYCMNLIEYLRES
jgi:5-methyltetrahydrofolate--homocysteine methyltransferase